MFPPIPPKKTIYLPSYMDWGSTRDYIRNLRKFNWKVPDFQRKRCWDAARVCSYLQSIFDGLPQTTLVAWNVGAHVYVLDGQHRLSALGADLSGEPCPQVRFDIRTCRWEPGVPDDVMTVGIHRLTTSEGRVWKKFYEDLSKIPDGEAIYERVSSCADRFESVTLPVMVRTCPESKTAWVDAWQYFHNMAQAVPLTDAERDNMGEYVKSLKDA